LAAAKIDQVIEEEGRNRRLNKKIRKKNNNKQLKKVFDTIHKIEVDTILKSRGWRKIRRNSN
jgi:hypothetical protein